LNTPKDQTILKEMENRLNDFFDEPVNDESDAPQSHSHSSMDNLKAILLSIEWEIDDKIMNQYSSEIETLMAHYADNKTVYLFLKLMHSIGKYLSIRKGQANPDAIKLLNSNFQHLQQAVSMPTGQSDQLQAMLVTEIKNYKQLASQSSTVQPLTVGSASTVETAAVNPHIPAEMLLALTDVIKQTIRDEFKEIKAQLQQWQQAGPAK
jgi:hypothetical protein